MVYGGFWSTLRVAKIGGDVSLGTRVDGLGYRGWGVGARGQGVGVRGAALVQVPKSLLPIALVSDPHAWNLRVGGGVRGKRQRRGPQRPAGASSTSPGILFYDKNVWSPPGGTP